MKALADPEDVRVAVRERYGAIARDQGHPYVGRCSPGAAAEQSCCVAGNDDPSALLGYSNEEIAAVPEGSDLGLGCGAPLSFAALKPGEAVADESVDVIISNCVINLSPDKLQVFREAFRVLRRGGRLAISDVVTPIELSNEIKRNLELHTGCLAGASLISELQEILTQSGFEEIRVMPKSESREFIKDWAPGLKLKIMSCSAVIQAAKP
jgi:SAM-dependent methyltransferase